jgi:hypothetical protein
VGHDNCVRFEGLVLQIPPDRHRCHYVKAKVRVHRYLDGRLALFHGPRKLAVYDGEGRPAEVDCWTEPLRGEKAKRPEQR